MKKGFTLIELLIVVAVIGILSGVVFVSLDSSRAKARDGKRVSDIGQIQLALEMYYEQNRFYPTTIYGGSTPEFQGVYNSTTPKDPVGGGDYKYAVNSATNPTNYHLGAILEQVNPSSYNSNANFDSTALTNGARFNGNSSDCGSVSSVPDKCYDVKG